MGSFDVLLSDERTQLDAFVEEYRSAIEAALDGINEEQARATARPLRDDAARAGQARHLDAARVVRGMHRRCAASGTRSGAESSGVLRTRCRRHHRQCHCSPPAGLRDGPGGRGRAVAGRRRDRPSSRTPQRALGVPAGPSRTRAPLWSCRHPPRAAPCRLSSQVSQSDLPDRASCAPWLAVIERLCRSSSLRSRACWSSGRRCSRGPRARTERPGRSRTMARGPWGICSRRSQW